MSAPATSDAKGLQLVGFPRSANTYLTMWCQISELPLLASHHHWDYALQDRLLATGVTTYVLIRDPAAVIASCMVWNSHHGSTMKRELNNTEGHFDLWRQFHDHALRRLVARGARVVRFEHIVDRSVAVLLNADGYRLCWRWSKRRYLRYQRKHLRKRALDPTTHLGGAFTGQAKPKLDIPPDICATYQLLAERADARLAASVHALPLVRKVTRFVTRQARPRLRERLKGLVGATQVIGPLRTERTEIAAMLDRSIGSPRYSPGNADMDKPHQCGQRNSGRIGEQHSDAQHGGQPNQVEAPS